MWRSIYSSSSNAIPYLSGICRSAYGIFFYNKFYLIVIHGITLFRVVIDLIGKGGMHLSGNIMLWLRKKIELFVLKEYAYIYVDYYNALKRFNDYLSGIEDEYAEKRAKDKDWMTVKYGYSADTPQTTAPLRKVCERDYRKMSVIGCAPGTAKKL